MKVRFDRGPLKRPSRNGQTLVVEGHAARVHRPGDPLRYSWGDEYRDLAELKRIVEQLPGLPVTLPHPPGLLRDGAKGRIVGRVDAAWLDGEMAGVRLAITDRAAAAEFEEDLERHAKGLPPLHPRELSLGYATDVRRDGYQFDSDTDHLAIVHAARCGASCSLRTDERFDCAATCACQIDRSISISQSDVMADKTDKQRADELEATVATLTDEVKRLEGLIASGAQAAETDALRKEKERADAAETNVRKLQERYDADVRARVSLIAQAAPVLGAAVRLDDLTDRQIHEAVIKRLDASINVASENDDQVRGRFNTLLALASRNAESQARVAEILGRSVETERKDTAETFEDLERNRWKNTLKKGRDVAAEGR